ncbi:putative MPP superfamily phosphohydrolase [Kibdelosporangium banguiense]|uniref:MPP superfamily phosphohydrolase n=2 Tax=Kibdelosporangium banguiense TaxID=1365924 RepID=A0ABS4TQI9_9PSEU|nr:putative MPP superfamily phosphohydrolase [Kibdelosporangium banguiense]
MRILVRSLILTAILLVMFGVPWWTLLGSGADWPAAVFVTGTVVFAAALVGFPLSMYLGHRRDGRDWAAKIGDTTLGVIWVLLVWSVIGQVLGLALSGVDDPLRARLTAGFVLLAAVGLLTWGYTEAMRTPRVKRVDVTIARLGKDLDGTRLVVVSDTHYGPLDRARWSARLADAVNSLSADIVCHAGDIADGTAERRKDQAAPLGTVQAGLAKVYVTGNHEYFSQAQGWLDHMAGLGWEPLHNRHIVVQRGGARLVLAGVDDAIAEASGIEGHGADLGQALSGVDTDLPVVLLAHQPKQIRQAIGQVDLQISGHTHGGQIWPFHYLVRLDQPSVHGLTSHGDRTQLYTTRGSGFWGPPFRIFAPSEITLITLRSEMS